MALTPEEEISSSEGDYSLSIMDLQRMWYDALMETLRITDLWGQALGLCDAQAVDLEQLLSVSWGNGVLYDADKDWTDTLSMVEAGLLKPELALAKKNTTCPVRRRKTLRPSGRNICRKWSS